MQTLKDRLVALLSSPEATDFQVIDDETYKSFIHVPTDINFSLDNNDLDELLVPFVVTIIIETGSKKFDYVIPANKNEPFVTNIILKGRNKDYSFIKFDVARFNQVAALLQAIDDINTQAEGEYSFMQYAKQIQAYLEKNYKSIQEPIYYYM